MKRISLYLALSALLLAGCDKRELCDVDLVSQSNAVKVFGLIDPRQDWSLLGRGTVAISVDAPLTMCFEDRPATADYDMNDVVLQAKMVDDTHVALSLVACGALDSLFLHGVEGRVLNSKTEIHAIFGLTTNDKFINTRPNEKAVTPVTEVVKKPAEENLETFLSRLWIENATTNEKVYYSADRGRAPVCIIVPGRFSYPVEGTRISNAYTGFLKWARNMDMNKNWYLYSIEGAVYEW